jgi:hypothetical protein
MYLQSFYSLLEFATILEKGTLHSAVPKWPIAFFEVYLAYLK